MSDRAMWKMLHLLYTLPPGHRGLDHRQLNDVGITCGPDTVHPLEQSGAVLFTNGVYTLSSPARAILRSSVSSPTGDGPARKSPWIARRPW